MRIKLKKSDVILIIIVLIIIVSFIFIRIFTYKSEPILLDYAKIKSVNIISSLINNSVNKIIYKSDYDEIIEIEKDSNANITNLNFNNKSINEILYLVTNDILYNIKQLENGEYNNLNAEYVTKKDSVYYVPIGIINDSPVLVNIGPKIPFKLDFLGSVNNETITNIKEYGINSSMVEVFVNLNLQVQIILPFKSETFSVNKNILLDSKIIQGKIPNYYGGIISGSVGE